jgi:hypothetical protein
LGLSFVKTNDQSLPFQDILHSCFAPVLNLLNKNKEDEGPDLAAVTVSTVVDDNEVIDVPETLDHGNGMSCFYV